MAVFTQMIDGTAYKVNIPNNRVETIIDRCDKFVNEGKFPKALAAISEFIVGNDSITPSKPAPVAKSNKSALAAKLIAENNHLDTSAMIKMLMAEMSITYANARYLVFKK